MRRGADYCCIVLATRNEAWAAKTTTTMIGGRYVVQERHEKLSEEQRHDLFVVLLRFSLRISAYEPGWLSPVILSSAHHCQPPHHHLQSRPQIAPLFAPAGLLSGRRHRARLPEAVVDARQRIATDEALSGRLESNITHPNTSEDRTPPQMGRRAMRALKRDKQEY